MECTDCISTHTLTWSVTPASGQFLSSWLFQLTRSRGAWLAYNYIQVYHSNFNSHAHVERDIIREYGFPVLSNFNSHAHVERDRVDLVLTYSKNISTHTLTWSVTIDNAVSVPGGQFQLTRSRGAWLRQKDIKKDMRSFQLTRSRGAWRRINARLSAGEIFQLTRSRGAWLLIRNVLR